MQILKNLYWVNGMIHGTLGNAYAIRHENALTLIDCGMPADFDSVLECLNYWGLGELPIKHVLLTHGHRDHAGNAKKLQEMGAVIYVHSEDAPQMLKGGLTPEMYPGPVELAFDMPPVEADVLFKDGDILDIEGEKIKVIGAPGHTPGSVVFSWETDGKVLFFTGDTCSCAGETADEVILGWKGDPEYHAPTYLRTLNMLFKSRPDIVLGGHGFPRMRDGYKVLRNAAYNAMLEYR